LSIPDQLGFLNSLLGPAKVPALPTEVWTNKPKRAVEESAAGHGIDQSVSQTR